MKESIRGLWATIIASRHRIYCDHQLGANIRPCIAVVLYTDLLKKKKKRIVFAENEKTESIVAGLYRHALFVRDNDKPYHTSALNIVASFVMNVVV